MTEQTIHTVCNDPVLPEDVKSLVSSLNNSPSDLYGVVVCAKFREAADMLLRLARELEATRAHYDAMKECKHEGDTRIAELEDERNAFEGSFIAATKRIAELEDSILLIKGLRKPQPAQSDE